MDELNFNVDCVRVYKKVLNKVILLAVFQNIDEANRYKKAFLDDTMELLIVKDVNEVMPPNYIAQYDEKLMSLS